MTDSIKNLKPPESVPECFRVSPHVNEAAMLWPIRYEERGLDQQHFVCLRCEQSVMLIGTGDDGFKINTLDLCGRIVSHLIQRHGWTRENTGER